MSTIDSSLAISEKPTADETSYTEEKELSFPHEELLSEPNNDFVNQTQINRVNDGSNTLKNGGSNTLKISLDRLLFFLPPPHPARERFKALQKWEGYVIEVGSDTFLARLVPIVGEGSDQEAEILLDELDEEDRTLIKPGAVFYWSIGYLDRPSGRERSSVIRFRRLPAWTEQELKTAYAEAAKLRDLLDVN